MPFGSDSHGLEVVEQSSFCKDGILNLCKFLLTVCVSNPKPKQKHVYGLKCSRDCIMDCLTVLTFSGV